MEGKSNKKKMENERKREIYQRKETKGNFTVKVQVATIQNSQTFKTSKVVSYTV